MEPAWEEDPLPQPFRFLNKLLTRLVDGAVAEAQRRAEERARSRDIRPAERPVCRPLGTATIPQATAVLLHAGSLYVGRRTGALDVYDAANNFRRVLTTAPLLPGPITALRVQVRAADRLPVVVVAGPDARAAGVLVLTLPGHPGVCDGTADAEPLADNRGRLGAPPPFEAVAHVSPTGLGLAEGGGITDLLLAPEGTFVAVGAGGKVLVFPVAMPTKAPPPPTPPPSSAGGKAASPGVKRNSATPGLPPITPPIEATESLWHRVPQLVHPLVIATCPGIVPPTASEASLGTRPFLHFWGHAAPDGPAPASGVPRRVAHTLAVAWQGRNAFTTFGLLHYNPYLTRLPLPPSRRPVLPREADDPASLAKGKKAAPKAAAPPVPAGPPPPAPAAPARPAGTDHLVPTLITCSAADPSSELFAVGCSEGVVVLWDVVLGVTRHVLDEERRALRSAAPPLVCTAVDFFHKKFLLAALGTPYADRAASLLVYDVVSGAKVAVLTAVNHVMAVKCLPVVPFAMFQQAGEPFGHLLDLKSGALLAHVPLPETAVHLLGDSAATAPPEPLNAPLTGQGLHWKTGGTPSTAPAGPTVPTASPEASVEATVARYLQRLRNLQDCLQLDGDLFAVVGVAQGSAAVQRLVVRPFSVANAICDAYPLFHQVRVGKSLGQVYQIVTLSEHADRLTNLDLLSTVCGVPPPTGPRRRKPSAREPRKDNRFSPRAVGFAANLSQELPALLGPLTAANLQWLAPKVSVAPLGRDPEQRLQQIQRSREAGRHDRESRLAARWQEMAAVQALTLK